jgi:lycopene beta-cyclase
MADVVVAGSGPAGWVIAHACALRGLEVTLVAPNPAARWPATYGMWEDECAHLPPGSQWIAAPATAFAHTAHTLPRRYAILDNDAVRASLTHPGIVTVADKIAEVHAGPRGCNVTLVSGRHLAATTVINATGPRPSRTAQTAYGIVLPVAPAEVTFMDWRPPPGFDAATFLYMVPLPGDRVLVEETSLARRPGLGFAELRARLLARGIPAAGTVERVRIPLDAPIPRRHGPIVPFGAAAGLIHPATGYSVADTFKLAPHLAEALAGRHLDAAWRVLWPAPARAVHKLRRRGLSVLLGLPPAQVAEFFEIFFDISPVLQEKYLSERADLAGTAEAMLAIFRAADWTLRRRIARFALVE